MLRSFHYAAYGTLLNPRLGGAVRPEDVGRLERWAAFWYLNVAAAFLGATTIMPGRFNPIGSIAAVYFLVTGITGLQLLGVETFVQQLFYGGALILAVALSQFARRRDASASD